MIDTHLPVLLIVVPLMAAPLCVLVRSSGRSLWLTIVVCWAVFLMASRLLMRVGTEQVIPYEMGGWSAPWGIEYRIDALAAFVVWLVAGMAAMVASFAGPSVRKEIPRHQHALFYAAYLLCVTGLMGIVVTGDLFNLFVFLEISSLSSYALISLGNNRRALVAAFQYLVMGTIGATFVLIGIGLSYQMTGTLNMVDLGEQLRPLTDDVASVNRTALVAFAFLSVGVSIKIALFPLHQWLPNAYASAPSTVTAFLAATSTKVSVYVLLRIAFLVYRPEFTFGLLPLRGELMTLALIGIFIASTAAIFQHDVKRLLAYSSIAQIGYIVLGISLATVDGVAAGVLHIFNHALIKGGLFMAMGCLAMQLPGLTIQELQGIGRKMPWTTLAWVLGGLGLIGVPVTGGFVSKWYLVIAAMDEGFGVVAALVLFGSLLAVAYVWRVVETAYFKPPTAAVANATEAPWSMLVPTYLVIGASLLFGVWTTFPTEMAQQAAVAIVGAK